MKNMKKSQLFTLMPALALMSLAGLTACSSSNDAVEGKPDSEKEVVDNQGNVGVRPEFVISFPRSVVSGTRMQDGVTQAAGTPAQPPSPQEQKQIDMTIAQNTQDAKDAGAAPEKEITAAVGVAQANCQEKEKEDGDNAILETLRGMI